MKVPVGLLDPQGQVAKGMVHLEADGNEVQEFGLTVTGKHSICYVLVSPGDVITANFALNSGITGEFADLVIDGVLRNSWPNTRGQKVFTYIFDRVVYAGNLIGENKKTKSNKAARMKVVKRNTQKDIPVDGTQTPSTVSSIKVQIYRKETKDGEASDNPTRGTSGSRKTQHSSDSGSGNGDASGVTQNGSGSGSGNGDECGDDATAEVGDINLTVPDLGVVQRDPNFDKFPTWQDLNRHIDSGIVPTPFEIGFFDGSKQWPKPKERVLREYPGDFKLWASFTFLLRSAADLRNLGFDDVPLQSSPNSPASSAFTATPGPTQVSKTESDVAQADDSVDALFVDDEGKDNDAPIVGPVVKSKKSPPKKKPNKGVTEQSATSTILEQLGKKNEKGKIDGPPKVSTSSGKESKPWSPKSKPETKETETRDQFIARKKVELVLPGVKSAPAHQAWMQRGATEEPEEDNDDMDSTHGTPAEKSEILSFSMHSASQNPIPQTQRLPTHIPRVRRLSSPPSLGLMTEPSTLVNGEVDVYGMPGLSGFPISSTQRLPTQGERRPSVAIVASELAPSTPPNPEDTTYLVPGFSSTLSPSVHGFSATTTHNRCQSTHSVVHSHREPVTYPHIHRFPLVNSLTPGENFDYALQSTSASYPSPQMNDRASDAAMGTGHQASNSNCELPSKTIKTESRRTTRPSTPEPSEIRTEMQPQPEVSEMTGISRPSLPIPSAHQTQDQTETQPRDFHMIRTTRPSSPVLFEPQVEATPQELPQAFRPSRPLSPAPSETPTETFTEVASPTALEASRKSSQRGNETSSNNLSLSQVTFSQQLYPQSNSFHTPQASFNHTLESPVLGSSQIFPVAHCLCMEPKTVPIIHPEPMAPPTQASLMSPPPSVRKRKADSITGADPTATIQPRKMPSSEDQIYEFERLERQVEDALKVQKAEAAQHMKQSQTQYEAANGQYEAERAGDTAAQQQRKGSQPHWEEEIKRQNEVARARMAAAEQQRKELQARYEAALAVQKEREKVNELNKDADKLERENAELHATIAALYHGYSV